MAIQRGSVLAAFAILPALFFAGAAQAQNPDPQEQEKQERKQEKREDRRENRQEQRGGRQENRGERREGARENENQGDKRDARQEQQENRGERREGGRENQDGRRDARQEQQENRGERREGGRENQDGRRDARQEQQENRGERREGGRENQDGRRDARQEFRQDKQENRPDRREVDRGREERREKLKEEFRREKAEAKDERRQDKRDENWRRREEKLQGLRAQRRERKEDGGRRVLIEEPDKRVIVRQNGRVFIRHDESERLRRRYRDARVERRGRETFTEFRRPNGVVIVTVTGDDGRLLRRLRRSEGRETVLFDNRPRREGAGAYDDYYVDLPAPRLRIPRERYIVDADEASDEDLEDALSDGPVEDLERGYSLDEIRSSIRLRERMRSVDLDTVTFDFGSWEIGNAQFNRLEGVADALKAIIDRNPDEVFLVEGHTDAVGSDDDNLSLSDRRAESVANVLSDEFQIPAENLVTQGYGEQFLKVQTEEPERANRRVTIRRVTPLLKGRDDRYSGRR